ncbi:MAG TPA: hypothetical protein PKA14_24575 [Leptospiraceae bacterium]|nr:hypothetical protein [Leptospiraceae bacterium]
MKNLQKAEHNRVSNPKYNLIQSDYRYEYPEQEQHKKGISSHLLFTVFFVMAGFLFYLTNLAQSVIASGATRDGVYILFSAFVAGIFLMFFRGARL